MASRSAWALVYCIDPEDEERKTYPNLLFDRDIFDGRGVMCCVLTLIGDNQGVGDVGYGRICGPRRLLPAGVPAPLRWPILQHHGQDELNVCAADDFARCVGALE